MSNMVERSIERVSLRAIAIIGATLTMLTPVVGYMLSGAPSMGDRTFETGPPKPASVGRDAARADPEPASPIDAAAPIPATGGPAARHMVAAAHPLAAQAGHEILKRGGSAVDAAVAMQAVLTLVEPQSSGIGGGAFMLHFDASTGDVAAYDGRETAPATASPDMFLDESGEPMGFFDAAVNGLSVGAPGVPALLDLAHRYHGVLPWNELFEPAIALAERGFAVTPRLHTLLDGDRFLRRQPAAASYFYASSGAAWPAGHVLRNAALAETLRTIAWRGADGFYRGPIAADMVARVAERGGGLTEEDLGRYRARVRRPICRPYRTFEVCGMPPPTSGGVAVLQILGLLEAHDLAALSPDPGAAAMRSEAAHLIAEAGRLAFADRNRYLADPDYAPVPTFGLLDPAYLATRGFLIGPRASFEQAPPGAPPGAAPGGGDPKQKDKSTSHFSIVDKYGNAVSMTSSIENAFGSRLFVRGFLLNNQLTDFSFMPERAGRPTANRAEPGKRPRSSMAPTIVLDPSATGRERFVLATGSPGGSRIVGYTAQSIVAVLDWGLHPRTAVSLGHTINRNGATDIEDGPSAASLAAALRKLGHSVRSVRMTSGLHLIQRRDGKLHGGADPRREGVVLGE